MSMNGSGPGRGERGASSIEYGLLIAAIAATITAIVFTFGLSVSSSFGNSCNAITSATPSPTDSC